MTSVPLPSTQFQSCGKWILSGEHTVLRGGKALVFPLVGHELRLQIQPHEDGHARFHFDGPMNREYEFVASGLIDRALGMVSKSRKDLEGDVLLWSRLPLGSGLGASAALGVLIAKWFSSLGWISQGKGQFEFAVQLENVIHGESSGVDVAVSLTGRPLCFQRSDRYPFQALEVGPFSPNLVLFPTGEKGMTQTAVERVKSWMAINPEKGQEIDARMSESVSDCEKAFLNSGSSERASVLKLAEGMKKAASCFEAWGLVTPMMKKVMQQLQSLPECLAVKPTGSGGGGYLLALFDSGVDLQTQVHLPEGSIICWGERH